jgi:hypothetical protein
MSNSTSQIFCCGCQTEIQARLTDGKEIYLHRPDLWRLKFWRCPTCGNYVGCHAKGGGTTPLGSIPTPELRQARSVIHRLIDPLWRNGRITRDKLYASMSEALGYPFHTADIRSAGEAGRVHRVALTIVQRLNADEKIKTGRRGEGTGKDGKKC